MSTNEDSGINYSYYCQRCKLSSMQMIVNDNGSSKPIIVHICKCKAVRESHTDTFKRCQKYTEERVVRRLICGHAIDIKDPAMPIASESKINSESNTQLDPSELRELNIATTLEFSKMNDEQKELHIQFHVAQYKLHLLASKKEKYIVQLLEDLVEKHIREMKCNTEEEAQLRRNTEVKFGYIFRKPEKRLEVIAKEKVREEKKVQTKDDIINRLREMASKMGVDITKLKG